MRRLAALAVVALVTSSCGIETLGREFPRCDFPFVDIPISVIMELQAIPGAEFGPCLNELAPGWSYRHIEHQTGKVKFWLDSDRLGDRFLTVTMTEQCDPGFAAGRAHPNPRIQRFVEATEEIRPVTFVMVPTTESARDYAASVGVDLAGTSVRGRPFNLQLGDAGGSGESVDAALAKGAFVIIVNDIDASQETVQATWSGGDEYFVDITLLDVVEGIEDHVEEGTYRATWFHLFEGGCVTFEFDAEGDGVANLVAHVEQAVGFVDLADIKRQAAGFGFILDESELDG